MVISSITQYSFSCESDSCSEMEVINQSDHDIFTLKDALKYLRTNGWKFGKKVSCPSCSEEEKAKRKEVRKVGGRSK